ncbi:MAG: bscS [Fibrobacteres bacterium]|nr:bscS [Fibrobacterota bacterium]
MTEGYTIDMTVKAMTLVLWASMPAIAVATVVGVAVSLIQALTQIQDQTLPFGIKLVAVFLTLFFTVRWVGSEIFNFAVLIFDGFYRFGA